MASTSSIHLRGNEPVFQWAFFVEIEKLVAAQLYVATVSFPSVTWEIAEIPYFSQKKKFASKFSVNDITLTIKDYVYAKTAAQVWKWWNDVGDIEQGTVNPPQQYKSQGTLTSTDGKGSPVQTWKLIGCWPSSVEFGDMDYSASDLVHINVTLSADKVVKG